MNTPTRIAQLKAEALTLRRELTTAVANQDDAGVSRIGAALRQNQDMQTALEQASRDIERFDREDAVRDGHREAHEALGLLMESLERRRALAADVDRALAALRQALGAFRANCTEAQLRASAACSAGFRAAPVHLRQNAAPEVVAAVSVTEGRALAAASTMLNKLFELQTPEGQHLWQQVDESLRGGVGYYLNTALVSSFAEATDALHQRMPDVLSKLYRYMATEAESLGATTTEGAL